MLFCQYIVGFCADLIVTSRVESIAQKLNYECRWIESLTQLAPFEGGRPERRKLTEPLTGPDAILINQLTIWQPEMILFDLGNAAVPWQDWIATIKTSAATRRIPVLCFGARLDLTDMQAAKDAGADLVLARSRFFSDLLNLIEKHARRTDYEAIKDACQESLSQQAIHGLELFNQGEYFEAHEVLEDAWKEDASPGRELYRAVLQVAVAYLQIERRNYNGAAKMFLRVRQWIDPLPDECRGVDVARLRKDASRIHDLLLELGPERIAEFDTRIFTPVYYRRML
jgi:hypothetical protein